MTALKPEYNNKISLMIALGPAMYFTYNQLLVFSFLGPHLDKITVNLNTRQTMCLYFILEYGP